MHHSCFRSYIPKQIGQEPDEISWHFGTRYNDGRLHAVWLRCNTNSCYSKNKAEASNIRKIQNKNFVGKIEVTTVINWQVQFES